MESHRRPGRLLYTSVLVPSEPWNAIGDLHGVSQPLPDAFSRLFQRLYARVHRLHDTLSEPEGHQLRPGQTESDHWHSEEEDPTRCYLPFWSLC